MSEPTTAPALLTIRGLSCGYGDRTVLRQLDFELPQNRTVCLLGPGGAGKSTLLRILADRMGDSDGFWLKGGIHRHRDVSTGFLGQRLLDEARSLPELLREASDAGEPNAMALEAWRDVPAARELMLAVLDLPIRRLPLPLARLAAFTSVLAAGPELVLLDEPDAEMGDEFRSWIAGQLRRLGEERTVVFTTHHLRLARQASDVCLLLDGGFLVESGPTEEMFQNPRLDRTRRFVEMGN